MFPYVLYDVSSKQNKILLKNINYPFIQSSFTFITLFHIQKPSSSKININTHSKNNQPEKIQILFYILSFFFLFTI